MPKYAYAWEKLNLTVTALAATDASIQERLASAWSSQGHRLDGLTADLPKDLRAEYDAIHAALTRVKDPELGAIRATCASMPSDEAVAIIERIVSLFDAVCRAHYQTGSA